MWGIIFVTLVVGTILVFFSFFFSFSLSRLFLFLFLFFVFAEVWVGEGLENSCFISKAFGRLSAIHSFSLILLGVVNIFFTCWLYFLLRFWLVRAWKSSCLFRKGLYQTSAIHSTWRGGLNFYFYFYVVNFISAGFCIPSCSYFRFM